MKKHCAVKIFPGIWEKFSDENNRNYNLYKFSNKFGFIPFLIVRRNQKQESNFQQFGGLVRRNIFPFCLKQVTLYFKGMSNSIDFYKRISLQFHGHADLIYFTNERGSSSQVFYRVFVLKIWKLLEKRQHWSSILVNLQTTPRAFFFVKIFHKFWNAYIYIAPLDSWFRIYECQHVQQLLDTHAEQMPHANIKICIILEHKIHKKLEMSFRIMAQYIQVELRPH